MGRNGGRQRNQKQRAYDRDQIARRYLLQHQTQREIAEALDISQQSVSRDLGLLAKEWQETAGENVQLAYGRELARLDMLMVEHWRAWDRSRRDVVAVTFRKDNGGPPTTVTYTVARRKGSNPSDNEGMWPQPRPGIIPPDAQILSVTRSRRLGDHRLLLGVQRCIAARIKMLGLNNLQSANVAPRPLQLEDIPEEPRPIIWIAVSPSAPRLFGITAMNKRLFPLILALGPEDRAALVDAVKGLRRHVMYLNRLIATAEAAAAREGEGKMGSPDAA